jgi:HAD superfamily hydrolase (TIGR01549 family)
LEVSGGDSAAARVTTADLVIFDFDGTLADSKALLSALVVRSLAESGLDVVAPERIGRLIGLPLLEVLAAASGERPESLREVAALYRRHAATPEVIAAFRLFPGARATLERLAGDGKRLAIATSKSRAITERILDSLGLGALILTVVGGDCVAEGRGKPHREAVDLALSRAGACRERALVVGDTTYDIEMGRSAGVVTIAATYGMHDRATLAAAGPACFIDDIAQLVA